jgi:hypothetical protein
MLQFKPSESTRATEKPVSRTSWNTHLTLDALPYLTESAKTGGAVNKDAMLAQLLQFKSLMDVSSFDDLIENPTFYGGDSLMESNAAPGKRKKKDGQSTKANKKPNKKVTGSSKGKKGKSTKCRSREASVSSDDYK